MLQIAAGVIGTGRLLRLGLASLVLVAVCLPVLQEINQQQRYQLDSSTMRLVGSTNTNLAKKLSYDDQNSQWQFNKDGIKASSSEDDPLAALRSQVGGAGKKDDSLYSVDLPTDGQKGIKYYDNNTNLSFSVVPKFDVQPGQATQGKLVYPFSDGGKVVYTAMNNGMKEDIVLSRNIGDRLIFRYDLKLPETLQAKILDDGSLGIYSADPTLFGNISFGTDTDRAKIENARLTAPKDHLLFAVPAPVIKQTGSQQVKANAQFQLDGSELILYANNMNSLTYPATVDPSVVVTSSSDFTSGNNEDNISFANGQINRGGLTGGSIGSWATGASLNTGREDPGTAMYNGRLYVLGGLASGATYLNTVEYSPINSDGTIGAWTNTAVLPLSVARLRAVAYNGYMYIAGGVDTNGVVYANVYSAPINTDGTLGTWTLLNAMTNAVYDGALVAYNGFLYNMGGTNGAGTQYNTTYYAAINANGTIGTWTPTNAFTTARDSMGVVAYNGFMYIAGGVSGTTKLSNVQYASINSDGTLGTWRVTSGFTTGVASPGIVITNGYMYVIGGFATVGITNVQYAPVTADGTVGGWTDTTSLTSSRFNQGTVAYNGYIYQIGGYQGGASASVQYTKADPAGVIQPIGTATSSFPSETAKGKTYTTRAFLSSVAYNGNLYILGGYTASPAAYTYSSVYYATIFGNGVGTWTATTSLPNAVLMITAVAYNGFMYVAGGQSALASPTYYANVYYAAINSDGSLGAWTAATSLPNARSGYQAVAYNDYLYIIAGSDATTNYVDTKYASISGTGALGAWGTTASLPVSAANNGVAVVSGGFIYIIGGGNFAGSTLGVLYAPVSSSGGTLGAWTTATSTYANPRYYNMAWVYNGCLYVAGGYNAITYFKDVQFAPITSNGSPGTWTTSSQLLPANRITAQAAVSGNSVFMTGGENSIGGTAYSDVLSAYINNGGDGQYSTTSPNSSLPGARENPKTAVYNGYIYVAGGYDGTTYTNTLWYARLTADGVPPSSWSTTTLPYSAAEGFGFQANNGYLYMMGGLLGSTTPTNVVYVAPINAGGSIGSWTSTTPMSGTTNGRYYFQSVVYNNYLYVIGGLDEDSFGLLYPSDTEFAPLNSDGTVGTWSSTASAGNRYRGAAVVTNGFIYLLGGNQLAGTTPYSSVKYAAINSDGTLGSWQTGANMITPRKNFQAVVFNGYLYAIGGSNASGALLSMEMTPLLPTGALGGWQSAGQQYNYRESFASTVVRGNLYMIGGIDNLGSRYATIEYGPLKSIARIGHYSKLIDLGATVSLSGFTYSGIVPGGGINIMFRTAGTDGIFNTAANINTLSGSGTGAVCGVGGGGGGSRYVWLDVTLDDSTIGGAVYYDSLGTNNANLTDITVNYAGGGQHPTPQQRLRGGKFFQTEVLQPLDTCGP